MHRLTIGFFRETPLFIFFMCVGATFFTACQKPEEGCMDPRAQNYSAEADADCCCTYYKLGLSLTHTAGNDTTAFSYGNFYADVAGDTFSVQSSAFFLSNFNLIDAQANSKQVESVILVSGKSGTTEVADDQVLIQANQFVYELGKFTALGKYNTVQFDIGLRDVLAEASPNSFEATHPQAAAATPNLYEEGTTSYLMCRIDIQLKGDTVVRRYEIPAPQNVLTKRVAQPIEVVDGQDTRLNIQVDYLKLLAGIAFASDVPSQVQNKILNNLSTAVQVVP